jgi:hypothetical protein
MVNTSGEVVRVYVPCYPDCVFREFRATPDGDSKPVAKNWISFIALLTPSRPRRHASLSSGTFSFYNLYLTPGNSNGVYP